MTYIIIKVGDELSIFANADCHVQVLLDWLRERMATLLPPLTAELDLCDESGNIRLLTELPATANALSTLQLRGIYHPVVRQSSAKRAGSFRLLQPPQEPERHRELQQRINRGGVIWDRLKQKLAPDVSHDKLLDVIQKAIARNAKGGSSTLDQWDHSRERAGSKRDRRTFRSSGGNWPEVPPDSRTPRRSEGGGGSLSARDRRSPNRHFGSLS